MKAFKILTLIFLCSSVHLSKIYAQKDYVITTKGDTLKCKIYYPSPIGIGSYQTPGMVGSKKIKIADIKEFYVDDIGITFRSVLAKRK